MHPDNKFISIYIVLGQEQSLNGIYQQNEIINRMITSYDLSGFFLLLSKNKRFAFNIFLSYNMS